jgi:hypothetical protein
MEKAYKNIGLFIIVVLAFVILGFYNSYYGLMPSFKGVSVAMHIHGAIMLSWFLLLIAQPILIRQNKFELHKKVGKMSYVIAPLVVLSILLVSKAQFLRNLNLQTLNENIAILTLDLPLAFTFAAFYILALLNKKRTPYHMRYMISTALLIMIAGTVRVFLNFFGLEFPRAVQFGWLLIAGLTLFFIIYDLSKRSSYKPYLIALIFFLSNYSIWLCRYTSGWQAFGAKWAELFYK